MSSVSKLIGPAKAKKSFRGPLGPTSRGTRLAFGTHGLAAVSPSELKQNQIAAVMEVLKKGLKDKGRIYKRVNPSYSITKKPLKVKMGGGKGKFDHWACFVGAGKILFEIDGLSSGEEARDLLRVAGSKLPMRTVVIDYS